MDDIWRIVGVDNGTSQMGICCLDYNFRTDVAKVVDMTTFKVTDRAYEEFAISYQRKGPNAARRQWMRRRFGSFIRRYNPSVVAIETPFIGSPKTISSFEPLALSVDLLIDEILSYEYQRDVHVDIEKVAPHEAKRAITPLDTKYDADKNAIKRNVLNHPCIDLNRFNLDEQEEDAIDSIAIGWTCVMRLAKF